MKLGTALQQGWVEVRTHWFRSLLTSIGIVMGVASLTSMMALTEGVIEGLRQFGTETGGETKLLIGPEQPPPEQALKASQSPGMTRSDAVALRKLPLVAWVSPILTFDGEPVFHGSTRTSETKLYCAELEMQLMDRLQMAYGRWLTPADIEQKKPVCVLGWKVAKELFGEPPLSAVGSPVTIRGMTFEIVGVGKLVESQLESRSKQSGKFQRQEARRKARESSWDAYDPFWWKNYYVAIPLSMAHASGAFGSPGKSPTLINGMQLGFEKKEDRATVIDLANRTLTGLHEGIKDFKIEGNEKDALEMEQHLRRQRITGWVISGISLFVGGLGIVNIMLASIADRVRELGVRLAVGAKGRELFLQVLGESILLATIAGLAGIGAGLLLVRGLEILSPEQNVPIIKPVSILIAAGSAVLVGFLAGLFPAWKAMQVSVIEALKTE